jgi:hypothetical protein
MQPPAPEPPQTDVWVVLARYLRRQGLAAPALLLLGIARPLGIAAAQCLALVQPAVPQPRWQTHIARMAADLEDEATWTRLEKLLH